MRPRSFLLCAVASLFLAGACGGGESNYVIPTDSPLNTFKKPAAEDLTESDDGSLADPVEEEDFEDPMAGADDSAVADPDEGDADAEDAAKPAKDGAKAPDAAGQKTKTNAKTGAKKPEKKTR